MCIRGSKLFVTRSFGIYYGIFLTLYIYIEHIGINHIIYLSELIRVIFSFGEPAGRTHQLLVGHALWLCRRVIDEHVREP